MEGSMTPTKWEKEYAKGTPHWAKDMEPSQFAKEFVIELIRGGLVGKGPITLASMGYNKYHTSRTILEIGCGNGRDSIHFAKKGFLVSAIDVSPSAVVLAKSNIEDAKVDVNIQEASAESLPFTNSSFDGVFSLSVLHSTNLNNSIPEVHRVLRSRGYAFIFIYADTQLRSGEVNETISLDNYIKLLKTSGFNILDLYTDEEEKFDSFGEKHKIFVAKLRKG